MYLRQSSLVRRTFSQILVTGILLAGASLLAQNCTVGNDLDPASKAAIENATMKFFNAAQAGDTNLFRQNSAPVIQQNFAQLEPQLSSAKEALVGGHPTLRNYYLLESTGAANQEFLCGVYGMADFVAFTPQNLPAGKYAVSILDVNGGQIPMLAMILQQDASGWKLANYFAHNPVAGHDGRWFWQKARESKSRGEIHNAWFYYLAAWDLVVPVPFMHYKGIDKLSDEIAAARPNDLPSTTNAPIALPANGKTYNLTDLFVVPVKQELDLVVKYSSPDVSNTAAVNTENVALMSAFLAKFPEYRNGFQGLVMRAVAPNGQEYGTLLPMHEIK